MPSSRRKPSRSISSSSSSSRSSSSSVLKNKNFSRHEQKTGRDSRRPNRQMIDLLSSHTSHTTTDHKRSNTSSSNVIAIKIKRNHNKVESMDVNDSDIIDLRTPVNETAPEIIMTNDMNRLFVTSSSSRTAAAANFHTVNDVMTDKTSQATAYQSRTLKANSERHSILPAFPTSCNNNRPDLLLANVPNQLLSEQEHNRRCPNKYRPPFHVLGAPPEHILVNTKIPSFFWPIYQELFGNVVEYLCIDMSIIDFNYARLSKCLDIWARESILRFKKHASEVTLDQKEYAIALEFYLQIDVDLFYMKTCSFRGAKRDERNKSLFCTSDPVAHHEMTACGNCGLCYPKYDVKRRGQLSVKFGPAQRHQFVNKYEAILNCPCSCDTYNIIYVLTCPCGKLDYVGESSYSLASRMEVHRFHGNRIMHEYFMGKKNFKLTHPKVVKSAETLCKDGMSLYRHSTECPSAVQIFLDENPQYWRFVPMSKKEADTAEQNMTTSTTDIKSNDYVRTDEETKVFIQNLPAPPLNYRFSQRQYHHQYVFFQKKKDLNTQYNAHLDLYNAQVIAVLPEDGSKVLRRLVEALFITHAETKLNSACRLVTNSDADTSIDSKVLWCEGLVRRPLPSFVQMTTTVKTKAVSNR